jgi:hypothetical protein
MASKVVDQHFGSVKRQDSARRAVTKLARVVVAVLRDRAFEALPGNKAPEVEGLSFMRCIRRITTPGYKDELIDSLEYFG